MSEIDHMVPPREPLSPPKAASAAGVTEEFDNTRARVLAALLDAHHTTFYTVISVIQATCFGFLVLVCFEEGTHFGVSQWLLAANTLVIIILVWNGFVRGFIVLSYVPKLVDGAMPFALGAAQCFAAYFVAHDVRGWYWSFAALGFMGFIGYVNAEVNARFNPEENAHVMVFYGQILRMLQISGLLLAAVCGGDSLYGHLVEPDPDAAFIRFHCRIRGRRRAALVAVREIRTRHRLMRMTMQDAPYLVASSCLQIFRPCEKRANEVETCSVDSDIRVHKWVRIVGSHFGSTPSCLRKIDEFLGIFYRYDFVLVPSDQEKPGPVHWEIGHRVIRLRAPQVRDATGSRINNSAIKGDA
jgi:hypothetical protein